MSKVTNLKTYLENTGASITPRQITGMFKIKNPSAAIHSLRSEGICVYANPSVLKTTGEKTVKYRVGKPTKAMIRAAYQAIAA